MRVRAWPGHQGGHRHSRFDLRHAGRAWSCGFPQELQHFVDCVLNDEEPLETGEDGRAVLEIILAASESAATGRRVEWPWEAPRGKTPQEVWGR